MNKEQARASLTNAILKTLETHPEHKVAANIIANQFDIMCKQMKNFCTEQAKKLIDSAQDDVKNSLNVLEKAYDSKTKSLEDENATLRQRCDELATEITNIERDNS